MTKVESFNLNTPPGFRGLHPDLPIRRYSRNLPHWRQAGATYFITFRLNDSIPQQKIRVLKRWRAIWERAHLEPRDNENWREFARQITRKTEAWLDRGYGECVFSDTALAELMSTALMHFQNTRCQTWSYTVLGNHVHALMKPLGEFELEDILESVKRFVSRNANTVLKRRGALWAPESYDRIVRDEEHLYRVIQYIGRNPRLAGLPSSRWVRWLDPVWERAGWRFEDGQ